MQSLCIFDATNLPGSYLDTIFQKKIKNKTSNISQKLQLCNFSKLLDSVWLCMVSEESKYPTVFEKKLQFCNISQISSSVCIFNVFRRVSVQIDKKKSLIFVPKLVLCFMKNFAQAYLVNLRNSRLLCSNSDSISFWIRALLNHGLARLQLYPERWIYT